MYEAFDVKRMEATNVSMSSRISMLGHVLCCVVSCCVMCAETRNGPIMSKKYLMQETSVVVMTQLGSLFGSRLLSRYFVRVAPCPLHPMMGIRSMEFIEDDVDGMTDDGLCILVRMTSYSLVY